MSVLAPTPQENLQRELRRVAARVMAKVERFGECTVAFNRHVTHHRWSLRSGSLHYQRVGDDQGLWEPVGRYTRGGCDFDAVLLDLEAINPPPL